MWVELRKGVYVKILCVGLVLVSKEEGNFGFYYVFIIIRKIILSVNFIGISWFVFG